MDRNRFWEIMDHSAAVVRDGRSEWLEAELSRLPADDLIDFELHVHQLLDDAYRVDLWGACYLIDVGCSEDGFFYFRLGLIELGRRVYEEALANPDTLADVLHGEELEHHFLSSQPAAAWATMTGRTEDEFYDLVKQRKGAWTHPELTGEDWDFEDHDEARRRMPRLCRIYLPDESES